MARGGAVGFAEFALRHGDFALSACACSLALVDGTITDARVGVGAVVDHPSLLELDLVGSAGDGRDGARGGRARIGARRPVRQPARDGRVSALADRRVVERALIQAFGGGGMISVQRERRRADAPRSSRACS